MIALVLQGATLGLAAAALPGPFQAFLLAESVRRGWRRALPLALVPVCSDGPVLVLVSLALSRLSASLLTAIRFGGGLFILYLAYGAAKTFLASRNRDSPDPDPPDRGDALLAGGFVKGVAMNLLNPNPWLFWSLVGAPILLEAWRQSALTGLLFLLSFYGVFVFALTGLIAVFVLAARLGPVVKRALLGVSALALAGFGLYQIALGFGPGQLVGF